MIDMEDELLEEEFKPIWLDGTRVNEVLFAEDFLSTHQMKCIRGKLFTVDGVVDDIDRIRKEIFDMLSPYISTGLPQRASRLLETIKLCCFSEPLPRDEGVIHLANGTYHLDGGFSEEKVFCTNRLAVPYDADAPKPERWLSFLSELLDEEDIPTLQEYMGYMLIPSTRAQRMMMLIGRGGEGKSRIGLVLRAIFGDNMNTSTLHKIENSRFARADLEFKLVMLDDDLPMSALPETNNVKSLVTNEDKTDIERKGEQSVQRDIYARFICFGNGALKARNDSSYAFYRRQMIIKVKPRPRDRVDDPFLADKLKSEAPGILLWAIEGLHRLVKNEFHFTESEQAIWNREQALASGDSIMSFMTSEMVEYNSEAKVTTVDLYRAYERWCHSWSISPMSCTSFSTELGKRTAELQIDKENHVNQTQRGFRGIALRNAE